MAVMGALILWGTINSQKMKAEHQLAVARALAWASFDDQNERADQLERSTPNAIEPVKREATSASLHTLQLGVGLLRQRVARLEQKGHVWGVSFSPAVSGHGERRQGRCGV
jgi:hypothetical protein